MRLFCTLCFRNNSTNHCYYCLCVKNIFLKPLLSYKKTVLGRKSLYKQKMAVKISIFFSFLMKKTFRKCPKIPGCWSKSSSFCIRLYIFLLPWFSFLISSKSWHFFKMFVPEKPKPDPVMLQQKNGKEIASCLYII